MNKRLIILMVLVSALTASAQVNRTVQAIRTRYTEVAEKARLAETDEDRGQYGDLIMNELEINKLNHPWRAVGIHGIAAKFFYTGGETEEHMYPDELVLVKVDRSISNRNYHEEFLYSKIGALILYKQTAENDDTVPAERGFFFANGKPFRVERGGKVTATFTAADREASTDAAATSARLKAIFATTLML